MVNGLLSELEDLNCWTLAEAAGHSGPHKLQHFLSRAVWDEEPALDLAAGRATARLDDGDGIIIIDETGDAKSSTDAVGAARRRFPRRCRVRRSGNSRRRAWPGTDRCPPAPRR